MFDSASLYSLIPKVLNAFELPSIFLAYSKIGSIVVVDCASGAGVGSGVVAGAGGSGSAGVGAASNAIGFGGTFGFGGAFGFGFDLAFGFAFGLTFGVGGVDFFCLRIVYFRRLFNSYSPWASTSEWSWFIFRCEINLWLNCRW